MSIKIEELRKKKGITQEEFAELMGVTQGAVSQWENGTVTPSSKKLPKIAEALGCSIEELFG